MVEPDCQKMETGKQTTGILMRQPTSTPWSMPSKVYCMYAEISAGTRNPRPPENWVDSLTNFSATVIATLMILSGTRRKHPRLATTSSATSRACQMEEQRRRGHRLCHLLVDTQARLKQVLPLGEIPGEELHGDRETQTGKTTGHFSSSVPDSNPRLTRWALAVQPYTFDVHHKPGVQHGNTDNLSRQAWIEDDDKFDLHRKDTCAAEEGGRNVGHHPNPQSFQNACTILQQPTMP